MAIRSLAIGALAALLAVLLPLRAPADEPSLRVGIPHGLASGFVHFEALAGSNGYLVIEDVVIPNPSRYFAQAYRLEDFTLIVGDRRYHPVVRPNLSAIDLGGDGLLGSGEAMRRNIVFLVPKTTSRATFEFTPESWIDDRGVPVLFCCNPPL